VAGLTPSISQTKGSWISSEELLGESLIVEIVREDARLPESAWSQFNFGVRRDFGNAGHRQSDEIDSNPSKSIDEWRLVAPGIIVRSAEYQARYSHLNLDRLREQLSPSMFEALVRHIGIFEAPPGVDVASLTKEGT